MASPAPTVPIHGHLRQRLTEAIGHVDAGIRAIRQVAFGLATEHE